MNQEQPQRPQEQHHGDRCAEPIKYGDVFDVSGVLTLKPVTPQDAAMMQRAEATVFGQGGLAAVMHSAAAWNERAGFVGHGDVTDAAGNQGVAVTETELPGICVITESVAGLVIGQHVEATPVERNVNVAAAGARGSITIGEALEAAGYTRGGKVVDQSDASAVQATEVRATGTSMVTTGGLASIALSAAAHNEDVDMDEDKIKLGEVLKDAMSRLPLDKVAMREDAEGVTSAELKNNSELATKPDGLAVSVAWPRG